MKRKRALLAAGLLAGAAAMTGCTANTTPMTTSVPQTQQVTAEPEAAASPAETAGAEETPGPIALRIDGKAIDAAAMREGDKLLLPLAETAQALGWSVTSEDREEETLTRRSVELRREDSRIAVSWVASDNTARQITWQKDGLLIPVDTELTTVRDVVYVPAAFFETAMRVRVTEHSDGVSVETPQPQGTPELSGQGEKTVDSAGGG